MSSTDITDEEWEAKVEAATKRPAPESWPTLRDPSKDLEARLALAEVLNVRRKTRASILAEPRDGDLDDDELDALVEKHKDVKTAERKREKAEEAADAAAITFHLRGLSPRAYDHLMMQHPPTEEQEKRGQVFNPDSFWPALFSACSVRPVSVEKAAQIIHFAGNMGDTAQLMTVLRNLNEQGRVSLGKGSPSTRS